MAKIKKGKEPSFAESIGLENLFSVRGKVGIYMLSGKPTKSGKWVRIYEINNFDTSIMVKIDTIRWLNDYKLPKLSLPKDINAIPSESYNLTELLDNLYKWKLGKKYNPRNWKSLYKNVIPLTPVDMVYESELKKLVYFYNYFISHINKL